MIAEQCFFQEQRKVLVADALIVLGTGDGKFFRGDAPVQQMPGPGFFLRGDTLAEPMSVKAGDQRFRADAFAFVIEPECRFARNGRQPMTVEMRIRMRKAGGVIPHFTGIADLAVEVVFDMMMQGAIGKRVGAVQHRCRHRPITSPVAPAFAVFAVDAAHCQYHARRAQGDFVASDVVDGTRAIDATAAVGQCGDAVAVQKGQSFCVVGTVQRGDQATGQLARRAPDDVIARQAVAFTKAAALDPVHRRQKRKAFAAQPVIHFATRMFDVVTRPALRPVIVITEFAKTEPVAQRDFRRVGNFHFCLQRRADQRHAAKRPQRQSAEALRRVAVHQRHRFAGAQQLQRGDDAGQATTDDQHVRMRRLGHHIS